MSFENLNKFIGKTLISDSTRDAAMSGHLEELLHEYNVDETEISEVLAGHPGSMQDLYVLAAQLQAQQESGAAGAVAWPEYEVGLPVEGYPTY
jgi:hypothetical protein